MSLVKVWNGKKANVSEFYDTAEERDARVREVAKENPASTPVPFYTVDPIDGAKGRLWGVAYLRKEPPKAV